MVFVYCYSLYSHNLNTEKGEGIKLLLQGSWDLCLVKDVPCMDVMLLYLYTYG